MKNLIYILIAAIWGGMLITSCDDINSKHDKWMQDGEELHVGKIDSFYLYSGKERALLTCWIGDYRATKLVVQVGDEEDDKIKTYELPTDDRTDSIDIYIDNLIEGSNQLKLTTYNDDMTVKSIPINASITTYGDKYQALLISRSVRSVSSIAGWVMISWGSRTSSQLVGQEISYTLDDGTNVTSFIPATETTTEIEDMPFDDEGEITVRSVYVPIVSSIDTFYTEPVTIKYPYPNK